MILTVYGATDADWDILCLYVGAERVVPVRYVGHDELPPMLCCGVVQLIIPNRQDAVKNTERLLEMLNLMWD